MAYKVLIAEDDSQIREIACDMISALSGGEIEMVEAKNGDECLELFYEKSFDLILLDIMLPGMNGFEICCEMRKNNAVPIVFITAKGREEDVLKGYACGCDDYIVKPFSFAQLYAKINALLKRSKGMILNDKMTCGKISLDPVSNNVTVADKPVPLAPKEYAILELLMENKGRLISRDTLFTKVWGYDADCGDRVVDNHIKKLRSSLGESGKHIRTVVTKGYRLEE